MLIGLWFLGWDDDCAGLAWTITRGKEWEEREHQNEAVQWGTLETDWEVTPPSSPAPRVDSAAIGSWLGVTAEQLAQGGTWPTEEEYLAMFG